MVPKWQFTLSIVLVLTLQHSMGFAQDVKECKISNNQASYFYRVTGKNINIRSGPNTDYKIIKEGSGLARLHEGFVVQEECREGDWLKIKVVEPKGLSSSHQGWVKMDFLEEMIDLPSGDAFFTESDFIWDDKTGPYKQIIIAGVNEIYRKNDNCKEITPSTAYISKTRRAETSPIFYVTCGKGRDAFNVFFSKADLLNGKL